MDASLLVVGATGLVGKAVLRKALATQVYERVIALTRRPIEEFDGEDRFVQHIVDFDNLEASRDLIQARDIVNAMGTTHKKAGSKQRFFQIDHDYPLHVATIARENGAQRCINVSSVGAKASSLTSNYLRVKGKLENDLRELGFPSYVILRPSLLLGDRDEHRAGENLGKVLDRVLKPLIPRRYRGIHADQIAERIIHIGQNNEDGEVILESEHIPVA